MGGFVYQGKANPSADEATLDQVADLAGKAGNVVRYLKTAQQVTDVARAVCADTGCGPTPTLDVLSGQLRAGWQGMGFVRAPITVYEAVKAAQDLSKPIAHPDGGKEQEPSREQTIRRALDLTGKSAEAGAMCSYVASMVASTNPQAAPYAATFKNVGDGLMLGKDALDLGTAIQDAKRASNAEQWAVKGQADPNMIRAFAQTKTESHLRIAKATFSVIGGVLTAGVMLGALKVAVIVSALISLISSIFAIVHSLYVQKMKEKPIAMLSAYNLSKAPIAITPSNITARPQAAVGA
ncbi:MAG: hypothetical protein HY069_03315 [Chlamydiia bacterium]|nr:hypothetical protein [Chlamydiia bacterium]